MGSNIENTTTGIGWLEKMLETVQKYHIWDFCKAFIVILFTALIVGFISNPTKIVEKIEKVRNKKHTEQIEWRLKNTSEIQGKMNKLMYSTSANRCVILSLHNGLNDINNIPYLRASAIFETTNNTYPIADYYQNCILSLIPFSHKLYFDGYFCGDIEDIKMVDKNLYHKLASNDCSHFCAVTIQGIEKPLGFIFLTYTEPQKHKCNEVLKKVQKTALELSVLLEINNKEKRWHN